MPPNCVQEALLFGFSMVVQYLTERLIRTDWFTSRWGHIYPRNAEQMNVRVTSLGSKGPEDRSLAEDT